MKGKMREIKFRAYHKEQGVMYSCSEINDIYPDANKITLIEEDFEGDVWTTWKLGEEVELMQFTGLKDKNGVEIYEGDIIEYPVLGEEKDRVGQIVYVSSNGAFIIFDDKEWTRRDIMSWHKKAHGLSQSLSYKVIGNIYENQELLKETHEN